MKSPTSEHTHSAPPETLELSQARTPLTSVDSPISPFFSYDPNLHHPNATVDFVQHSPSPSTRPQTMILPFGAGSLPASLQNYYHGYDFRQFPTAPSYVQYLPTMPTLPQDVLQTTNNNNNTNNDPSPIVK